MGGLTLTDYESALAGVVPGDAAGSVLVQKQEEGGHPGQLDDTELDLLRQWIDAGALAEASDEEHDATETETSWSETVQPLLDERCGACHGTLGGLNLADLDSALTGGDSGPAIVPGDVTGSLIVQKQEAGGHPGQLDDAELDIVAEWIELGAPE
jgi:transposase